MSDDLKISSDVSSYDVFDDSSNYTKNSTDFSQALSFSSDLYSEPFKSSTYSAFNDPTSSFSYNGSFSELSTSFNSPSEIFSTPNFGLSSNTTVFQGESSLPSLETFSDRAGDFQLPPSNSASFDTSDGSYELAKNATISTSPIPSDISKSLDEVAGRHVDLSGIKYVVVPSWQDVGSINPPLSNEAVTTLESYTGAGIAFIDRGNKYGAVSQQDTSKAASRIGVNYAAVFDYIASQEITQSRFPGNSYTDGKNLSRGDSELIGEAVAAKRQPLAALGNAVAWSITNPEQRTAGYNNYLQYFSPSLDEAFKANGIAPQGNVPASTQFLQQVAAELKQDPQSTYIGAATAALQKITQGKNVSPTNLLNGVANAYAKNLSQAAKSAFPPR